MEKAVTILDMNIDRSVPIAPYYQISEEIRRHVSTGRLKPGEQLPPVRRIAESCDVSPFTVKRAYDGLVREGVLISRPGAGTFVAQAMPPAIEVIVPYDEKRDYFPDKQFLQQILSQTEEEFEGESRRCFMSHITVDHCSAAEIISVCRVRRVEGLVVYRPHGVFLTELQKVAETIPTVSLVYPIEDAPADCVAIDPRARLRRIVEKRLDEGRREFAFVGMKKLIENEEEPWNPYHAIRATFMETLAERGIEAREYIFDRDFPDAEAGRAALAESLPPGAVVLTSFPALIAELPTRVRRSLNVISYTEYHETLTHFSGVVSILYAGIEVCTRSAIGLLRERLKNPRMPARTTRIEPEIYEARCGAVEKGGGYVM